MKKTITVVAMLFFTLAAGAQESNSNAQTLTINTEKLEPIEYSSMEELKTMALPRIEVIKAELAKPNLYDYQIIEYKELLWRFENAIVVTQK